MPLLTPVAELQVGMKLARPLLARGQVLLQAQRELTTADIEALRRRYPLLSVSVIDPLLDELINFEDDARERSVVEYTHRQVSACLGEMHDRFAERAVVTSVQIGALQRTVRELAEYLKCNRVTAALVSACLDREDYLGMHAANVFYLSMMLSYRLLDYVVQERRRQTRVQNLMYPLAADLVPLGVGVLVMDLAMRPLLPLLARGHRLTPEEEGALRAHPQVAADALPDAASALTRMLVRTHHETAAGTGYPRGLAGPRVHVFARIVRIADAFDAATAIGAYAEACSPARVLWELSRGPYRGLFDATLMDAFAGVIQPFPIGAKLRLSDGRIAAVVRYNRFDPFDPELVIAFSPDGRPLPREQLEGPLQLSTRPELRLAAQGNEDLSFLYDTSLPAAQPRTRTFRTAFEAAYP